MSADQSERQADRDTIASMRREYAARELHESEVDADPTAQFRTWFQEAIAAELHEPNAMVLSTADEHGQATSRIVLLKDIDETSLFFFTNYNSRKARDIAANPKVCLLFFWAELERQVRIEGHAEQASREISEAYFATRPRGSQIGAWASPQSSELPDRDALAKNQADAEQKFGDGEIPCPPFWGGYRVTPNYYEFWQGGRDRLHDRLAYTKSDKGSDWVLSRLSS